MGTLLLIFVGVVCFFVVLYKGWTYQLPPEEIEKQKLARMNDEERHQYYEEEIEKIRQRERTKWVRYEEPSKNILGTEIMGIKYRSPDAKNAVRCLVPGSPLRLLMEPKNKYDKFAVKILTDDGIFIGYVQKEYSELVTKNFDCILDCRVSCIPDDVESMLWGVSQCYGAVIYFTEDIELPDV